MKILPPGWFGSSFIFDDRTKVVEMNTIEFMVSFDRPNLGGPQGNLAVDILPAQKKLGMSRNLVKKTMRQHGWHSMLRKVSHLQRRCSTGTGGTQLPLISAGGIGLVDWRMPFRERPSPTEVTVGKPWLENPTTFKPRGVKY
ncbi:MAG: hypothetical protein HEQ17_00310 [Limnohabitans sp.]|nr:hypothetical protein [Limnohabitans sp.]